MAKYLRDMRQFENIKSNFGYIVVIIFSLILLISAIGNAVILTHMDEYLGSGVKTTKEVENVDK